MPLEQLRPEQVDALGQMSKPTYDEYKNLGYAGITADPVRYLTFRKQAKNGLFTQLMISDAGIFFVDPIRKIKFKFHREYFFVYHAGLTPEDEQKIRSTEDPVVKLDNGLEFWKRVVSGTTLIKDHTHDCDYLLPDQKAELERVKSLSKAGSLVIKPMLQNKTKDPKDSRVIDLDS
jgi:hypothetical protein